MNERMKKIMDFERQLLQNRMQLQHLIEDSELDDTALFKAKIDNFERDIRYMEEQIAGLRNYIGENRDQEKVEVPNKEEKQPVMVELSEPVELNVVKETINKTINKATQPLPKKDLEKAVGKSFMGIVASVLIFISIVLFANLLLPYFNDFAKMICMYLVSFGFLIIGLVKMDKDADNKFFVALSGCGVGALYISLLLSNMYFGIISDIPLFIFIAIWAVGVCFLAKRKNKVFQIIGRMGVTISVIVGGISCSLNESQGKFIVLILFYLVAAGVFYVTHYEREYAENWVSHVFGTIDMTVLSFVASAVAMADYKMPTIIVMVILAVYIGVAIYGSIERSGILFGICVSIKTFLIAALVAELGLSDLISGIIIYTISIAVIVLVDLKKSEDGLGKNILTVVLLWVAYQALDIDNYREFLVVPLLALPLLGYGFVRANEVMKFAAIILFAMTEVGRLSGGAYLALTVLVFATGYILIYMNKEQYNKYFKWFHHVMALLVINAAVQEFTHYITKDWDLAEITGFLAVVLLNVAMCKSVFATNLGTGKQESGVVYNIANVVCMIMGLGFIAFKNEWGIWHMLVIVATLAAFMVNAKNILDKRDNMIAGIYVGIKFLVLMVVIFESFEVVDYVVSIACFIMAIVSIVIGFVGEYKSLRVFGLVLSMISTFKLIMFDISYADSLGNALSFFASGVLCFVISLIYNYIDGKIQKKE